MSLREKTLSKSNPRAQLKRQAVQFMGEVVWAWELSGRQRDLIERFAAEKNLPANAPTLRALLIEHGTRDSGESGAPRTYSDGDGSLYLSDLPAAELEKLAAAIIELSGMGQKAGEDAKKNSEPTPGDASSIAPPIGADGQASTGDSPLPPQAS